MAFTTLITVDQLEALRTQGARLMVFDCSFDLARPASGLEQYQAAHIPGAVHADLDTALSDHPTLGDDGQVHPHPDAMSGGRHPLPSRERFALWLSSVGFANDMQAVVYDRQGANYCGRLWWMLKWAGHDAVAVLDGGWQAWIDAGGHVNTDDEPAHFQSNFGLRPPLRRLVGASDVAKQLGGTGQTLVDARAAPRYHGEVEPLDPVAGHIPGALNRPFASNLGPDGRFKSATQLRAEFDDLLQGRDPAGVVAYCGSGVSAVPNVIAMELAGLPAPALFAGSWSEWCSDRTRPVERG
ncbi:sulfurtransferase [Ramlibacter algicola]|uniref:Sulfurtransferase n=1 Tax=Ramlibacter algicola TaxID=2795217 RepID=A0A934Q107_9BURK|nr:sulfurtransferase [Ramlibacter algicola]MBK0394205.1 sulfurtransferase [Ramlibacter algicola]